MIKFDVTGLDEIIKQVEEIATPREIEQADKKALKEISELASNNVKKIHPKSKNVTKSGRKGSRTFKHAKDNIPIKIKKKKGKLTLIVGWEKSDTSPYFYEKFIEWGTSKVPPEAPFRKTFEKQRELYDEVFKKYYEQLVERLN